MRINEQQLKQVDRQIRRLVDSGNFYGTKLREAGILETEVGRVFARVLEHAGVYKRNAAGKEAFMRFVGAVNGE